MNIKSNHLYFYSVSFFQEKIVSPLTAQRQRILSIVFSILLGFGLTFYVTSRCFLKTKSLKKEASHLKSVGKVSEKRKQVYTSEVKSLERSEKEKVTRSEKRIFPDGIICEGRFNNNQLEGFGKKICSWGLIEEGYFKNGKLNGKGKRIIGNNTLVLET